MMESVQHQRLHLPRQVPVMFLPNTVLLPHVLLPLFIFEPRYRAMLEYCLEQQRIFCVAMMRPGISDVSGPGEFFDVAGAGLVRACVQHEDGTSHLVLQGLARVRLGAFIQETPFRIMDVTPLSSVAEEDAELPQLCAELRERAAVMLPDPSAERQKLQEQLAEVDDPGVLSDVIAHTFLQGGERQQKVLEELNVGRRVREVLQFLREEAT